MKYILIFNGYPESGKTTIEKNLYELFPSIIHSSIDPIKKIVQYELSQKIDDAIVLQYLKDFGLGDKKKTQKYRQLLSNVKRTLDDFCDYSLHDCMRTAEMFMGFENVDLLMIDIREPHNIAKFVTEFKNTSYYRKHQCGIATIFVKRESAENTHYNNDSDSNVEKYPYDFKLNNSGTLDVLKKEVIPEFVEMLQFNWEHWGGQNG